MPAAGSPSGGGHHWPGVTEVTRGKQKAKVLHQGEKITGRLRLCFFPNAWRLRLPLHGRMAE